jgi:hypothetical protein
MLQRYDFRTVLGRLEFLKQRNICIYKKKKKKRLPYRK